MVDALIVSLDDTRATVESIYGLSDAVNGTVTTLVDVARGFSIAPARQLIVDINTTIANSPDFSILTNEIAKVLEILKVLPCMQVLVDQLETINSTLFALPPELEAGQDILNLVNESVTPALDKIDEVQSLIDTFQAEKDRLDLDSLITELDDVETQIDDNLALVESNDLVSSAQAAEQDALNVDWNITEQIRELNSSTTTKQMDLNTIA